MGVYDPKTNNPMLALESLTPGGSEFVKDPERCVKFIRNVRENEKKLLFNKIKLLNKTLNEKKRNTQLIEILF